MSATLGPGSCPFRTARDSRLATFVAGRYGKRTLDLPPLWPGSAVKRTVSEFCRLINFMDVLYYVGDMLYKKSLRYSLVTGAVSLLGFLGGLLPGVETYPARVAILMPLIVGGSALAGGLLLKMIPSLISARLMGVAEAQDLDLMEDYRKAREEEHLEALWQRIYQFEWRAGSAATAVHAHEEECPAEVCLGAIPGNDGQQARRQFLARARFALARPQPQSRQRYHLGIDLRYFEDWRNGAFFDRNDKKLAEQFDGSSTLRNVKDQIGYGSFSQLADVPLKLSRHFWFMMLTRVIGIHVGEAVCYLNDRYGTDCFNAQALLWPGEEDQPWLDQFPLAREELLRRRLQLIRRLFGSSDDDGQRMLDRVTLPTYWLATRLRLLYDPEYLDGSLGYDALSDLAAIGVAAVPVDRFRELASQASQQRQRLQAFLQEHRPELLDPPAAESLRALRIAIHTGRDGLDRLLDRYVQQPAESMRLATQLCARIEPVFAEKDTYSTRLLAVRMHHELARLHHQEYRDLLSRLRASTAALGWRPDLQADASGEGYCVSEK